MPGISKSAREDARRLHAEGLKRCPRCAEVKAHSAFNTRRLSWDDLSIYCRVCLNADLSVALDRNRAKWAPNDPYADATAKRCPACATDLPRSEFATDPTRVDGLNFVCRPCDAVKAAAARGRHRSRWATAGTNPHDDPSPKRCGSCKQIRPRSDFGLYAASHDGLNWACRGCAAASTSARRALILGQFVENVDRDVVWERDQGTCYLCGLAADPRRWDLEHIHPIVHGGLHSYDNTAVSHPSCNYSKGGTPWPDVSFDPAL